MPRLRSSALALVLAVLVSADWGRAERHQAPEPRTTCLEEAIFALEGRVVIYDVVVSVSQQRVFLIGPHEKLWVVKEMPASHDHTVPFAKFFQRGWNASAVGGSFCR